MGDAVEGLDHPDHGDQHAGGAADRRVQGIGKGVDPVGIDAHDPGRAGILRRRPDRLPHAAAFHEQHDCQGERAAQQESRQLDPRRR